MVRNLTRVLLFLALRKCFAAPLQTDSPEIEDSPEARKSGLVPVVEIEDDGYDDALRFVGTDESWLIPRPPFIDVNTSVKTGILGHGATNESPTKAYAYCYPFTYDEVLDKCLAGALEQPGVIGLYLPLMMEIQQKHENVYYEKVAELRKRSDLEVVGIAYDNPRWDLIRDIVNEFPGTFSGVMVEWIGQWACVNQIFKPKPEHLDAVHANTTAGILRYFFRDQNLKLCMGNDHDDDNATVNQPIFLHPKNFATDDSFSPPEGLLPLPDFFEPVFACFGGNEGFCYRAFHEWPDKACSELQRFSFNPFELGGGRMMHLANETCHGLNGIDLYGTL